MDIKEIEKNVIVEDGQILIDRPLQYIKYGKRITVKQLNYYYEWGTFSYYLAKLLERYYLLVENCTLPDNLNDIEKFRSNFKKILVDKSVFKLLERVCSFFLLQYKAWGKWHNGYLFKLNKIKWMRKNFSIDDYLELFVYVYLYNIQGQKKNFKDALNLISKAQ